MAEKLTHLGDVSDLPGSGSDWQWVVFRGVVIFLHHKHRPRVLVDGELDVLHPLPLSEAYYD